MIEATQTVDQMISALVNQSAQIKTALKSIGVGDCTPRNIQTIRHAREFCFDAKQVVLPAIEALSAEPAEQGVKTTARARDIKTADLRKAVNALDALSYRKGKDIDLADGMLAPFS